MWLAAAMGGETEDGQSDLAGSVASDEEYPFPYTSVHVGTIQGGTALNIVPEHCEMQLEFRTVAGDDPRALLENLRATAAELTARPGQGRSPAAVHNQLSGPSSTVAY